MNIDRLIKKILIEQDTKTKGLNYSDQADILTKGKTNCPTFAAEVEGRMIKELPSSEKIKFSELSGYDSVAYITKPMGEDGIGKIFFGIKDPSSTDKVAFLSYGVMAKKNPQKYKQGWGADCEFFQTLENLGKDTLGPEQKRVLDDYLARKKESVAEYEPTGNMGEWTKLPYNKIPGLESYKGPGYVWTRSTLVNVERGDMDTIDTLLQPNFTRDETTIEPDSPEFEAGIFLKDLVKEIPRLAQAAQKAPNLKVYPVKGSLIVPERKACKEIVKTLSNCKKQGTSLTPECSSKEIFKSKMLALQCNTPKYNFVKGVFGIEDEFNDLKNDATTKFGLANLIAARQRGLTQPTTPQKDFSIKESLSKKISKILNEEYRRLYNL